MESVSLSEKIAERQHRKLERLLQSVVSGDTSQGITFFKILDAKIQFRTEAEEQAFSAPEFNIYLNLSRFEEGLRILHDNHAITSELAGNIVWLVLQRLEHIVTINHIAEKKYARLPVDRIKQAAAAWASLGIQASLIRNALLQPGTSATLDVLDTRFQNAPAQITDANGFEYVFCAHTVAYGAAAGVLVHKFNMDLMDEDAVQIISVSATDSAFNPHLAVNGSGIPANLAIEISDTDASNGINDRIVVFTGNSTSLLTSGAIFANSSGPYGSSGKQLWGSTSSVFADPSASNAFVGANEYILNSSEWGTKLFKFHP